MKEAHSHNIQHLALLDLIRGIAALAVVSNHARALYFLDFHTLETHGWWVAPLYLATGFGHQAVIVFFVLSGLLISQGITTRVRARKWAWKAYAIDRLSRLYVVLLPALLLGGLWDTIGVHFFGHSGVYHTLDENHAILNFDVPERLTPWVGLGNALFLHEIFVPPFGSNGPLWSLSYEFWYYTLFPTLFLALRKENPLRLRLALAFGAVALTGLLGYQITLYFSIWLLGWVAAEAAPHLGRVPLAGQRLLGLSAALSVVAARLDVFPNPFFADLTCALLFSAWLAIRIAREELGTAPTPWWHSLSRRLSNCSFSLYVTHFPLLVFVQAWLRHLKEPRWTPDPIHVSALIAIVALAVFYAWVFSQFTEARTSAVRSGLRRRVMGIIDD